MSDWSLNKIFVEDKRILPLIGLFIIVFATFQTIPYTENPAPYVQDFYDVVEAIQPGDKVLIRDSIQPTNERESTTVSEVPIRRMVEKGATIIWLCSDLFSQIYGLSMAEKIIGTPLTANPIYGESFVFLGYQPIFFFALAQNPRESLKADFFGTSLDSMSACDGWESMADISIFAQRGYGVANDLVAAYILPYPGIKGIEMGDTGMLSGFLAVYSSRLWNGLVAGTTAGAQYERMLNIAGPSTAFVGSGILLTGYLLILLVLSSVIFLARLQRTKGRVEVKT